MLVAVLLGLVAGIVGFLPLIAALRVTKHTTHGGTAPSMVILLLGLLVSFLLLFAFAMLFFGFDRDNGLIFLFAEVIALCGGAIGFALYTSLKRK